MLDTARRTRKIAICGLTTVWIAVGFVHAGSAEAHDQRTKDPNAKLVKAYAKEFRVSDAAAETRLRRQHRGYDIAGALTSELGDRYAGVWFDNDTGRFNVPVVSGAQQDAERVVQARQMDEFVDFVPVEHSFKALEGGRDATVAELKDLLEKRRVQVGLDDSRSAVQVMLSNSASAEERRRVEDHAAKSSVPVHIERTAER